MCSLFSDEPTKRTLGVRDKQILWERVNHKCEACGKQIDFTEMQVGHKTAYSKGGSTTLRNSACLCYKCNKLQGTDSWSIFLRKMGKEPEGSKTKKSLKSLNLTQLKYLAKVNNISVKGRTKQNLFSTHRVAPSKTQYINAQSKLPQSKTDSDLKKMPAPEKKKKRRKSSDY